MAAQLPFHNTTVAFDDGRNHLVGTLAEPDASEPHPALAFVHGSGPMDRDSEGRIVALRAHLASHGYACLSYDKPGVGDSTGDWREQSFDDRARESAAAVRFLQAQPEIVAGQVGLIGGSQAGWVMPLAALLVPDLACIISISGPAVTAARQEHFRVGQQMRVDGYPEDQIAVALALHNVLIDGVRTGRPAAEIVAEALPHREQPWFSYFSDVSEEDVYFFAAVCDFGPLPALRQLRCPFLGLWGDKDTFVPVEESMRLTREALAQAGNTCFELKLFPNANHGLRVAKTGSTHERSTEYAPGFLDSLTDWLAQTLG